MAGEWEQPRHGLRARLRRLGAVVWFLLALDALLVGGVVSSLLPALAAPPTGPLGPEQTESRINRVAFSGEPDYLWRVTLPPATGDEPVTLLALDPVGLRGLAVAELGVSPAAGEGVGESPRGVVLEPGRLYEARLRLIAEEEAGEIRGLRLVYGAAGRVYEIRLRESFVLAP